jgi:hypothetical protein
MECERKTPFHLFPLSPQQTYLNFQFFSFDLEVLLYHGDRSLLTPFLPFPRSINYHRAFRCNKSFTPSLSIWFCLKIWFFSSPWNHGVVHGHILRAPNHTREQRTTSGVISKSDLNVTSSWWRTQTSRSAHSSWSWTSSSLVLLYFSKLSHFGDLVAR